MTLEFPDKIIRETGLTKKDIILELALMLYQLKRLSAGQASRLAGISRVAFQMALGERKIPINYGVEDLNQDLETIKKLALDDRS